MKKVKLIYLTSLIIAAIFTLSVFSACKKEKSCFSASLKNTYKDKFCTMDCPGVLGCDGKTYCNECIAAKEGISIIR